MRAARRFSEINVECRDRVMVRCVSLSLTFLLVAVATFIGPSLSAQPAQASQPGFRPITPVRALDTRLPQSEAFGPGAERSLSLADIVPSGATGVALNVTAVAPSAATFLTVWPSGRSRPVASNVNVSARETRPNAVIVGVGDNRSVSLFNFAGSTHVLVDVMGYFVGGFNGVTPTRVMDTRIGKGATTLGPGMIADLRVGGTAGVPVDAAAVAINITAVNATAPTYLTAWPAGRPQPATSNVNAATAAPVPNMAVVALDRQGAMSLFNAAGRVDVIVDVMGWFDTASGFTAVGPNRLLDTRIGTCGFRLGAGETRTLTVTAASDVGSVALNVTAADPTAGTFLTVWPAGQQRPATSNVNVAARQSPTPNFVLVGVGAAGQVQIYNESGAIDVVVDIFATFFGTTPAGTRTPCTTEIPPPDRPTGGSAALNPLAALHRAVGTDTIATYVCRVPLATTNSYYRQYGSDRVAVSPSDLAALGNTQVSPLYRTMSRGRYLANFVPVAFFDLGVDEGPHECLSRAIEKTGPPFTNVFVTDDADSPRFGCCGGGFAGPGIIYSNNSRNGRHLIDPPSITARGGWVDPSNLRARAPFGPFVLAHELGHTLHWPHSYRIPENEYDNPVDFMSGKACLLPAGAPACHTLAFNRFLTGWIDDHQIEIHQSGSRTVELVGPAGEGIAFLAALSSDPNLFVTLEARPPAATPFGDPGVAVHVIDQRTSGCPSWGLGACPSIDRRQGQAVGRSRSFDHVIAPGGTITFNGLTITVDRTTSSGYVVTVSGTFDGAGFAWPTSSTTVITEGEHLTAVGHPITEYGPDDDGDGVPDWVRRLLPGRGGR